MSIHLNLIIPLSFPHQGLKHFPSSTFHIQDLEIRINLFIYLVPFLMNVIYYTFDKKHGYLKENIVKPLSSYNIHNTSDFLCRVLLSSRFKGKWSGASTNDAATQCYPRTSVLFHRRRR